MNEHFFECRFGGRANAIEVPNPFDANELFRRITHAEIETFFGSADEATRKHLHEIGQEELERLLQRDR